MKAMKTIIRPSAAQLLCPAFLRSRLALRRSLVPISSYATEAPMSTQSKLKPVYANFAVYKGKSALSLRVRKPRWTQMQDGGFMLERAGGLVIELAPVSPNSSNEMGNRAYNWDKKQVFVLSIIEIGELIQAIADKIPIEGLFHDPGKGRPGEDGRIAKTLKLNPLGEKGDWYLGLEVRDSVDKENSAKLGVPLSGAELHVIRNLAEFLMPRLVGWDEVLAAVDTV